MCSGTYSLNWISELHGISVEYLCTLYPELTPPGRKIPQGTIIRFNRPDRWLVIADWFSKWDKWVRGLPDVTRTEQNRMFITHQLHNDLQRTCHSMYDIVQEYIVGNPNRKWIPRAFSQDVLESFFAEVRQSAGGNRFYASSVWP